MATETIERRGASCPFDFLRTRKQVVAAINRNNVRWLLTALPLADGVSHDDLIAMIQHVLRVGREQALNVVRQSRVLNSQLPDESGGEIASLLFEFGPAIILMLACTRERKDSRYLSVTPA